MRLSRRYVHTEFIEHRRQFIDFAFYVNRIFCSVAFHFIAIDIDLTHLTIFEAVRQPVYDRNADTLVSHSDPIVESCVICYCST